MIINLITLLKYLKIIKLIGIFFSISVYNIKVIRFIEKEVIINGTNKCKKY